MTWELVWMLVVLKIPVVYLCLVVWWAVRAEPRQHGHAVRTVSAEIDPRAGWRFPPRPRRPRPGPHGSPNRGYRRRRLGRRWERAR